MASRNIGRPRGAEAGLCFFSCYLFHIARIVMCASRLLVRGCKKEHVRAASTPGFLLSHVARSLVSANVCRRLASSGAAAASSEACDMWVNVQRLLLHVFFFSKTFYRVKNQHLTEVNKRRRLEWCTSMLQRLGEAKRL